MILCCLSEVLGWWFDLVWDRDVFKCGVGVDEEW